jgi:hypothetical protein
MIKNVLEIPLLNSISSGLQNIPEFCILDLPRNLIVKGENDP